MALRKVLASPSRFGAFWASFSMSVLGDAVTKTALIWYVLDQTGSAVALGWLSFWFTAPVVAGGLLAGWLPDRFDRRRIMALDSAIKAGIVLSLPVLASLEALEIWHVYLVASELGFLMMIPLAGVPTLLTSMVEEDELNAANSLESIGFTFGGVAGPPIAGFLIVAIGPLQALYLDAATYLLFALVTLRCQVRMAAPDLLERTGANIVDAARVILGSPVLLSTTAMYLIFNVGLGALLVAVPVLSDRVLSGGPQLYGTLLACLAIGELVGSLTTRMFRLPIPEGIAICLAAILSGAGISIAGISEEEISVGVGLAFYGAFSAPLTVWGQTLRMKIIPQRYHGRCFAIMRTLMQSGGPAGGLTAGFLLSICAPRAVISGIALLTVAIGAAGLSVPKLRTVR